MKNIYVVSQIASTVDVYILPIFYLFPPDPGHSVLWFEIFVATNLRYGHCANVQFNTGHLLLYFIVNKCMPCNLIAFTKIVRGSHPQEVNILWALSNKTVYVTLYEFSSNSA